MPLRGGDSPRMPETNCEVSFPELLEAEARKMNLVPAEVCFPAGHVIFQEGEFGDGVYLIDEGVVEISGAMPESKCRILSTLGKGSFFGEMAVVDEQPRSATAKAKTAIRARFFSREEIWRLFAQSQPLLVALMREVTTRMRRSERRCMEDVFAAERRALVLGVAQLIIHALKNPVNTIGIGVDLAFSDEASSETRKEAALVMRKEVDRLVTMIGELLEFTRGVEQSQPLVRTDFREFIEGAIAEIRPGAEARGVKFEWENEPPRETVALDGVRLRHMLNNLVNNAVEAMPGGGKIVLRFRVAEHDVLTEVEDTGRGIAPAIITRLFEPFVTHGKEHGTGLGLSICKRIVEDHGGEIRVRSEPGRGAVFSFTLPRQV